MAVARILDETDWAGMHTSGDYSITDLGELFSISRPTVYRALRRVADGATTPVSSN